MHSDGSRRGQRDMGPVKMLQKMSPFRLHVSWSLLPNFWIRYWYKILPQQWLIQDFPEEEAPTPRGVANIRFCQILPKTAWNWKKLDPQGGACPSRPPLRFATAQCKIQKTKSREVFKTTVKAKKVCIHLFRKLPFQHIMYSVKTLPIILFAEGI